METVAIVGVGLIGASFSLALKKAGFAGKIIGVSSAPAIEEAGRAGAIDESAALEEAVARADLVYIAQPVRRILRTLAAVDPWLRPGSLVTDAGSTKAAIVAEARRSIRRAQFLGGHPLAGKEKRGAAAAEADLFRGRPYVLTPDEPAELDTAPAREFRQWLERIGAIPITLTPQEHDRVVAFTSHLPQLLSTALAATLAEQLGEHEAAIAGPGLHDMTRLAASSFDVWADILQTNAAAIDQALGACVAKLEHMRAQLYSNSLAEEFDKARRLRDKLPLPAR